MSKKPLSNGTNILPNLTTKPINSKDYVPLSHHKQTSNHNDTILFEMPSINCNQISCEDEEEECHKDREVKRLQAKVARVMFRVAQERLPDWEFYVKKSEIMRNRGESGGEIEEFLLKFIAKLTAKMQKEAGAYDTTNTNLTQLEPLLHLPILNQSEQAPGSPSRVQHNASINQNYQMAYLQKSVQMYKSRVKQLQQTMQSLQSNTNQTKNNEVSQQKVENVFLHNKIKQEIEFKSLQIDTMNDEILTNKLLLNEKNEYIEMMEMKYSKCKEENAVFREYLKYKQLWVMASEELRTWRYEYSELQQELQKYHSKIKILKEKNKQLLNYFNMTNAVSADQSDDKEDLDTIIHEFKEWLKVISVPKVKMFSEKVESEGEGIMEDKLNYRLLRPNFYIFFEAYENTLLMEKNIINIRPIEYVFFAKLRAIFDSMYNNFLTCPSYKQWPPFPEFVIGFLEKYDINQQTMQPEYRHKPLESEEKLTFLVNLFNKNLCNTWQCEMFRSFLLENYYLDQIFFFLDCRNEINGGRMTCEKLGAADPVGYIRVVKVMAVVQRKLAVFEGYIVERVKSIIRSKRKNKFGSYYIDQNFVLKLLLEVYSLQKHKSERIFEANFPLKPPNYLTYSSYHTFLSKNFPFLTSTQISELYRQTYTLCSGHLTPKAIHYVCGIRGLFIPLMLNKRIDPTMVDKSLNDDMQLLDMQNAVYRMKGVYGGMGCERIMKVEMEFNDFMRQFDHFRNNKAEFYRKVGYFQQQFLRINTYLSLYHSTETSTPAKNTLIKEDELQSHIIELHSSLHQNDKKLSEILKLKEKKGNSLKMIIRNFKIRINDSLQNFAKLKEEDIEKLKQNLKMKQIEEKQEREESQLIEKEKDVIQESKKNIGKSTKKMVSNNNLISRRNIKEKLISRKNV